MKINWEKFTRFDENEPLSPLVHVFMYINLVFGVCFTWFPYWSGAAQTSLYQLTTLQTHEFTTSIWGICAVLACVFALVAFNERKRWMGGFTGMFGFGVWLFAAITYIIGGYWFGLLAAAVPMVFFWGWLYFTIERFHRKHG